MYTTPTINPVVTKVRQKHVLKQYSFGLIKHLKKINKGYFVIGDV